MSEFTLHFFDGVGTDELEEFSRIVESAQSGDTVTMELCNGGGSVFHGIAICDMMKAARDKGVCFVSNIWGYAASAACLVALSADKVFMSPNAAIMYHSAWSFDGNADLGIKIANDAQLTLLAGRISRISAKDFNGDDHWVTSEEALSLGIIDGIIGKESSFEDSKDIKLAAQYIIGGTTMTSKVKAEEIFEEKKEEIEKKEEELPEAECGDREEEKAEDMDVMEAIVERLGKIEERLSVLESEGKTQEDYDHDQENAKAAPSASARRKALLAKLNAVCAPVQPVATKIKADTVESRGERCKNVYANFDSLLADYIKRK